MWCVACGRPQPGSLCAACARRLHRAPHRRVGPGGAPGLLVRAAYLHEGTARRLVHLLKYEGSRRAAKVLAESMAAELDTIQNLIPIPRSLAGRWRYGVDQSVVLAEELAKLTGASVHKVLTPPLWQARHAGSPRRRRHAVAFELRSPCPHGPVALIDDVVTTGATLWSAARILARHIDVGVVATSANKVTSLHS